MTNNKDVFKRLRNYHARLATVINELEILEDFEGADYSEIQTDLGWIVQQLEHRRTTLQKRGRCL